MSAKLPRIREAILEKAEVRGQDECWLWKGVRAGNYGRYGKDYAHRLAFELFIGPIAPDHDVHHTCETKLCVNWHHLEQRTRKSHVAVTPTNIMCRNRLKTHCRHGHEFSQENTRVAANGGRYCRICARDSRNASKLRNRGQINEREHQAVLSQRR